MNRIIFIYIALALIVNAQSLKDIEFQDVRVSEVTSIYDGDTFRVNIKDYPRIVGQRMAIRIKGIDTPEIRGKCVKEKELAQKAKQMTVSLLKGAKVIELRNIKRGKYFRLLADVYVDGVSVGCELIKSGLAIKYNGGTKSEWCK